MRSPVRLAGAACAAIVLVVLVACAGPPTPGATGSAPPPSVGADSARTTPSRLLDPSAFAAAIADPRVTTVNVHVPYAGDIPGTRLSIPFDRIGTRTERLPADRRAPLALYCRTGPMSAVAARTLADQGYTNIVELAGGMAAWTSSGRPLLH